MNEKSYKRKINLNVGCGKDKRKGFINIDKNPNLNPDKVCDIEKGLPFKDKFFDYILCSQVLEHIKNLDFVMKEIYRIAKPNAIIHIEVPYYRAKEAFTNPDHKRFFTEDTFGFFSDMFHIVSIKKQRGRYNPFNIHGLKIILKRKGSSSNKVPNP